jgi:hypothetical protein
MRRAYVRAPTAELARLSMCEEVEERCSDRRRRVEERVSKPGEPGSGGDHGCGLVVSRRSLTLAPQPPGTGWALLG